MDIQMNCFYCILPPSIAKLQKRKDEIESNPSKKLKRQSEQIETMKNPIKDKNWKLRVDEIWDTTFKNKSKDGPMLSCGCKLCSKYHAKGICYN
jgi:hypothetical protein